MSVIACVRKGRPPDTFCCLSDNVTDCCESGLLLHISNSNNISKLDDNILIPYPEPDVWFVSFTTTCTYEGLVVFWNISLICFELFSITSFFVERLFLVVHNNFWFQWILEHNPVF